MCNGFARIVLTSTVITRSNSFCKVLGSIPDSVVVAKLALCISNDGSSH